MKKNLNIHELNLEDLLIAYQNSSAEAFNEFFTRTKNIVYNFLNHRLRNQVDADDVFQETYFRVHRYVTTYNPEKKAIVWLMTIARNAMLDRMKARRKELGDSTELEKISFDEKTEERLILKSILIKSFSSLSENEVVLMLDRIFQEDSYDDISKKHGISAVNARQKISRIIKKLRNELKK